jgi:hypothetical protein
MVDDEIEKSRREEEAHAAPAKRDAAEEERTKRLFSRIALKAKKAKDARAYAEALRNVKIREGSDEWKNAWKFFDSE